MIDYKLLRGIFVGVFISFAYISLTASESTQTNQALERRVSALEERVAQLEGTAQPSQTQTTPVAVNKWRQLENNMTMAQVLRLLGEPDRVSSMHDMTIWYYGRGTVNFSRQRVNGWDEPR